MSSSETENFIQFPPLPAAKAFRVLEGVADVPGELEEAQVRLVADNGRGRFLAPHPEVLGGSGLDRRKRTIDRLLTAIAEHSGKGSIQPSRVYKSIGEFPPLGVGAAEVLIAASERRDKPEGSGRKEKHYLVVAYGKSEDELLDLIEQLRFRATGFRFATAQFGDDGSDAVLLKVLDDADRGSIVQGLIASGRFAEAFWLNAYQHAHGIVYLSEGFRPDNESLSEFGRLASTSPQLFGLAPGQVGTEVEIAVVVKHSPDGQDSAVIIPLDELDFRERGEARPRSAPRPTVAMLKLQNSDSLVKRLHQVILTAERQRGYRLSLRRLPPTQSSDREVEQIEQQLRDLEDRRLFLESTKEPQWLLMRFLPHQVDAMAEALRGFDIADLESGEVRYAFEPVADASAEEELLGQHFLLFDPAQVPTRWPFAEFSWRRLDPPIRFWMDPYWNLEYGRANQSKVMVPLDHALYPPLHSWHRADMDAYLREIVGPWFTRVGESEHRAEANKARAGDTLPEKPIYLFDAVAHHSGRDLSLQVLDEGSFVPVERRLSFINRNIVLLDSDDTIEALVRSLADDAGRKQLAETFAAQADEAGKHLATASRDVSREITDEFGGMLEVVRREFTVTVEKLLQSEAALKTLHAEFDATAAVLDGARRDERAIAAKLSALGDKAESFWEEKKEIETKINEAIGGVDSLISSTEQRIMEVRGRLHAAIDRLEDIIWRRRHW